MNCKIEYDKQKKNCKGGNKKKLLNNLQKRKKQCEINLKNDSYKWTVHWRNEYFIYKIGQVSANGSIEVYMPYEATVDNFKRWLNEPHCVNI